MSTEARAMAGQHIPLAKCRVLYLGSAVPLDTKQGIEAVQIPLRERYPLTASGEVRTQKLSLCD